VDDDWCDSNCRGNFLSCPKDKCRCFTDTQALKDYRDEMATAKARDAMVKEKVAAPVAVPEAATEEESLGGNCPKFVGLAAAADGNPKFKRWAAGSNDDEFCEKNCRAGFCPEAKCRCITDPEPEAVAVELPVAPVAPVVPVVPLPVAPVAPKAPVVPLPVAPKAAVVPVPEEESTPLMGSSSDACPKYVTLDDGKGGGKDGKSKFSHLQVDDDWCDSNCRGNFLSCPKDKCRCFTDTQALKDFLAQAAEATRAEEDDLVGDDATLASARAADRAAIHSQPGVGATEEEELAGNCPKFVSLKARNGVGGAIKSFATTDEYCEKNCRAGFCPESKCRCTTDPEPEPSAEQAAALELPVAPVAPVVPLPVAPKVPVVAPLVAPTAPVVPAEDLAGNCPSFVGLAGGQAKSKFNKVFMTDDEYCEKNCRAGFCPESRCRCSTDPEPEPSDASAEEAATVELPVAPLAANAPATAKDDCPSYVSNLPPAAAGGKKGPFKRVDDDYCEKNCRQGFCPEASCRCSTEPAPESSLAVDEAAPVVDWRKNQKSPPAPAQPAAWWKKDEAGESSAVTGDDFADDGADWEPKGSHQEDDLGATDDSWLDGAEVYEEGTDEGPTIVHEAIAKGSASSLEALAQALVLGDLSVASLTSARRSVK